MAGAGFPAANPGAGQDLDFEFARAENLADVPFFGGLARIRQADPVFWSNHQQGWLFTRYQDVIAGFSDPRLSAKRLHINQFKAIAEDERAALIPNMLRYVPHWIINVDGEQHARLRRLVIKAFSPRIVEAMRPQVIALVDEILDDVERKAEVEFIEDVAFRLPATVIMRLLGLPEHHAESLRRWGRDVTYALASQDPSRALLLAAEQAFVEMGAVFGAEFHRRRSTPTPDLMTELLLAREDHDSLTEDELIGMCHVILLAGHDTTANSLGLGLVAWLRHPQQRAHYLANPRQGLTCITELLRHVAMASTQIRVVTETLQVGGKTLQPGQIVFLMIAAANRDPAAFADPDRMILDRDPSRPMTFAPGLHHCVGHLLARMELDVFFRALFDRFSSIELLDQAPAYSPNYAFRGLVRLPVRLAR